MEKLKEKFEEVSVAVEANKKKVEALINDIEKFKQQRPAAERAVEESRLAKDEAYEGLVLGEITEAEVEKIVEEYDRSQEGLTRLDDMLKASEKAMRRLEDRSVVLGREFVTMRKRILRALADEKREQIKDVVGDLVEEYLVVIAASVEGLAPGAAQAALFPTPHPLKGKELMDRIWREEIGI